MYLLILPASLIMTVPEREKEQNLSTEPDDYSHATTFPLTRKRGIDVTSGTDNRLAHPSALYPTLSPLYPLFIFFLLSSANHIDPTQSRNCRFRCAVLLFSLPVIHQSLQPLFSSRIINSTIISYTCALNKAKCMQ